jgi:membrane-associated HD superfamily phosphohydrolase
VAKSREVMCFRLFPPDPTLFSEAHPTMTPIFSIFVPFHLIFILLFKHIDMWHSQCNIVTVRHMSCSTSFSFFLLQCFAFFVPAQLNFIRRNNSICGTCFLVALWYMIVLLLGEHTVLRNKINLSLPIVFDLKGREF